MLIHSCTVTKQQLRSYRQPGHAFTDSFSDPVKPRWCIVVSFQTAFFHFIFTITKKRSVNETAWVHCRSCCRNEPLGSTDQNCLRARLLPMAISIYPVVCVHSCRLLRAQYHCLWPIMAGRALLRLARTYLHHPPLIHPPSYQRHPLYYRGCKNYLKNHQ